MFVLVFIEQKFATLKTHTSANFHNVLEMLDRKYRSGQFDVAKISGSIDIGHSIRWTNRARFKHTHSRVEKSANHGFVIDIRIAGSDLYHGILPNFFGREYTKLDTNDFGRIFVLVHL